MKLTVPSFLKTESARGFGKLLPEKGFTKYEKSSSMVNHHFDNRLLPPIPFRDCKDFYKTIGRVQNTVDGNRFDGKTLQIKNSRHSLLFLKRTVLHIDDIEHSNYWFNRK